ncbi:MAG TPA: tripartite tricarboxylate transporter substrate binding protein [Burkholderiales bacterium]|jgi:tripartite-type tricarboxylate transporter receptor subunit TctC|nr:tripartite tricarboxylate transporter substrate binding protein [Burkholderiales bacterium]
MKSIFIIACALLAAAGVPANAQTFPAKPVRLVVPFPPGGPADGLGRLLAEKLKQSWGESVIVENRGGAGGNIGAEAVAKAAPDGYTLLLNASNHVINSALLEKMPFDPIKDFTPITEVASYMLVLVVHPSVAASSLREFVALGRSKPKSLLIANAGNGTPTHLTAALFAQAAGIEPVHVPYKGAAPANTDLLGGQVHAMFNNPVNALPQVKAGRLRALAVTGSKRTGLMPDLPTVAESGYPGFEATTWYGLFGPAGIPREIAARIHEHILKALRSKDVQDKLAPQGWDLVGSSQSDFAAFLAAESDKWARVVKGAGIKPD